MGRGVLGGGWCTIEGPEMGFDLFSRKTSYWGYDFAKHGACRFFGIASSGMEWLGWHGAGSGFTTFDFLFLLCFVSSKERLISPLGSFDH